MKIEKQRLLDVIRRHEINLSGYTVLTEAASGSYLYTPLLCALAGCDQVIAVTQDSHYGLAEDVLRDVKQAAKEMNVLGQIEVLLNKTDLDYSSIDIVTNSGFVRPINHQIISQLPEHAVIPLMWETWEYRGDEVDLSAAKLRDILVLGTDESHRSVEMQPYVDMLLLKLLFELKLSGYKSKIMLLASDRFGMRLAATCRRFNIEVAWFADNTEGAMQFDKLNDFCEQKLDQYEAVIIGELKDDNCYIGDDGSLLTTDVLLKHCPKIKVGVIAGNVDAEALESSNITYIPKNLAPPKYVSYQMYQLGILPVIELYAAGLKVGQEMAFARKQGWSIVKSIQHAIENSAAMDFQGELAWI